MASITPTEAGYLSTAQISDRFHYDCRPTDQLFQVLPFIPIEGDSLKLGVISAALTGLSSYAGAVEAGGAVITSMPSITTRSFAPAYIAGQLQINISTIGIYGNRADIVQACLNVKVDAVRDNFKTMLIEGSGASGQFSGIRALCTSYSQVFGADNGNANGGTVAKGEVEKLLGYLHPRVTNRNTFLVMHPNAYRHLLKNNYQYEEWVEQEQIGTVPVFAGIPVLLDEFIPVSETVGASNDCTSIYAVMIGKDVGLVGIYPSSAQGREIQVRGPVVKDVTDEMWYQVSWDAGIAVYNKCSIARMNGVKWSN